MKSLLHITNGDSFTSRLQSLEFKGDVITWREMLVATNEAPVLLTANQDTRLYYQPAADFAGVLSDVIIFRAWDQTGSWTRRAGHR